VADHILCGGDAAGMITPLCGNGMAMAIQAGKLLSEHVAAYFLEHLNRNFLETQYAKTWQQHFDKRLQTGRLVQKLFGRKILSEVAVGSLQFMPGVLQAIIKRTHGEPF